MSKEKIKSPNELDDVFNATKNILSANSSILEFKQLYLLEYPNLNFMMKNPKKGMSLELKYLLGIIEADDLLTIGGVVNSPHHNLLEIISNETDVFNARLDLMDFSKYIQTNVGRVYNDNVFYSSIADLENSILSYIRKCFEIQKQQAIVVDQAMTIRRRESILPKLGLASPAYLKSFVFVSSSKSFLLKENEKHRRFKEVNSTFSEYINNLTFEYPRFETGFNKIIFIRDKSKDNLISSEQFSKIRRYYEERYGENLTVIDNREK